MAKEWRQHSASFKAKVVLEATKGEGTVALALGDPSLNTAPILSN